VHILRFSADERFINLDLASLGNASPFIAARQRMTMYQLV